MGEKAEDEEQGEEEEEWGHFDTEHSIIIMQPYLILPYEV